jgi:rhodanese-related sulfurtransferase
MKKTISTEKLQTLRKANEGFVLIDVLSKADFDLDHIPGARNVPVDSADFAKSVAEKGAGSKTRKVVLYGRGGNCDAAARGAKLLGQACFTNVVEYEGGMQAWNESKRARLARTAKTS